MIVLSEPTFATSLQIWKAFSLIEIYSLYSGIIGVKKKIIIVNMGIMNIVMYNPAIVKKNTPYETERVSLSLGQYLAEESKMFKAEMIAPCGLDCKISFIYGFPVCTCKNRCSDAFYGRTVHVAIKDNPRLFNDPLRGSKEWKLEYNLKFKQ